jgi:nonribosomal peptide synthetase protein BlmVII
MSNPWLETLRALGVVSEVHGGNVTLRAPPGVLTAELRGWLAAYKEKLLAGFGDSDAREESTSPLPLSREQHAVWLAHELAGTNRFNLPLVFDIKGSLDAEALRQSFAGIVRRHGILRTRYVVDGEPMQIVEPRVSTFLRLVDLSGICETNREQVAEAALEREMREPFDLRMPLMIRLVLLQLAPTEHRLIIIRHHIATDGWSLSLFLRELAMIYDACRRGVPVSLEAPSVQYVHYALAQQLTLDSRRALEQDHYWRARLKGATTELFNQLVDSGPERRATIGWAKIDEQETCALRRWCVESRVTLFSALLTAFVALLFFRTRRIDLLIATDYVNRTLRGTEALIGMFVRRLPLRCSVAPRLPALQLARRTQTAIFEACSNPDVPFDVTARLFGRPGLDRTQGPVQALFGLHAAPRETRPKLALTPDCRLRDADIGYAEFPMELYVTDADDLLLVNLRTDPRYIEPRSSPLILSSFVALVHALRTRGDGLFSELEQCLRHRQRRVPQSVERTKTAAH